MFLQRLYVIQITGLFTIITDRTITAFKPAFECVNLFYKKQADGKDIQV